MKTSHNFNIVVQVRSMQRMVFDRKRNKWNFVETYETNETYFVKLYQGSSICSNIWGMSLVTCISVKMLDWVFIVLSFRQRDVLHAHVGLFNRSRFRNVRKKKSLWIGLLNQHMKLSLMILIIWAFNVFHELKSQKITIWRKLFSN